MTTWRQIAAENKKHPDWTAHQIADELGTSSDFVRAMGQRHGFKCARASTSYVTVRVPILQVLPFSTAAETPRATVLRLFHRFFKAQLRKRQRGSRHG